MPAVSLPSLCKTGRWATGAITFKTMILFSRSFWKELFGPDEFTRQAERLIDEELAEIEKFTPKVKKVTMGDGSVHFRAYVSCIKAGKLGPLSRDITVKGGTYDEPVQFSSYEQAKARAEAECAEANTELKRTTILKIEEV